MVAIRPRKSLGQHFLTDRRVLQRILAAASLSSTDTVIEAGAGKGVLTQALAAAAGKVIAVEIDEALCAHLRRRLAAFPNVEPVCGDILSISPDELLTHAQASPPYVVVANLPYYIASAVLRHLLESARPPTRMIVMVQAEVGQSIAAPPGRMSLLSVGVQFYAQAKVLFYVPPRAFHPPPKVRSAVIRLDVRPEPAVAVDDRQAFFRLVHAGFAAPRKQLRNALALGLGIDPAAARSLLDAASIDPQRRAQTLSLDEWGCLYRAWRGNGCPCGQQ
ncbi:MAG: 16S rRNA (adenine(1518)-N(6)/adenine(1519)-N(6))-dimethyltransferase RsmA [Dehalococcoidia bacterium]|nr:16S rRNA (adenine(1518)-N(6)/adenine(1519)-N(6))-dimethyltransferase RsmA [Dehalococcoidia bacterium]